MNHEQTRIRLRLHERISESRGRTQSGKKAIHFHRDSTEIQQLRNVHIWLQEKAESASEHPLKTAASEIL